MAKIIIFGTGKGADIATRYIRNDSDHEIVAYTLNSQYIKGEKFNDLPVVAFEVVEKFYSPDHFLLFAPLGFDSMNKSRAQIFEQGKAKGYHFATYVHSSVKTLEPLVIGENCFILENQSINLDVKIGDNVTMWSGNQVGDRSVIGDHVWLSSHVCISGDVVIKPYSILAVNCTISNNVTIEEENFIGANALISKSTLPREVYIVPPTPKAPLTSDRFMKMFNRI
jgi:sugar O-acyltransferase (sialic acid O-acetyltransferase NeuD family)